MFCFSFSSHYSLYSSQLLIQCIPLLPTSQIKYKEIILTLDNELICSRSKTGLLSNTWKFIAQGDICTDRQKDREKDCQKGEQRWRAAR